MQQAVTDLDLRHQDLPSSLRPLHSTDIDLTIFVQLRFRLAYPSVEPRPGLLWQPPSSSNSDTSRSNLGRVQNNSQAKGNSEVTIRNDQCGTSTTITDSTRRFLYINDLRDDPAEARPSLSHLAPLYDNSQTNGNESKA